MRSTVLLAALTVAACAPTQWSRQDASPEQRARDARECQDEAVRKVQSRPSDYITIGPMVYQDSMARRLNAYPSGPYADPYGERFMEEGRLANACMRARGYELVTIQPSSGSRSAGKP